MPNWIKWIIGILGCFAIAWLVAKFNPWADQTISDKTKTETAIAQALEEGDHDWASFTLEESEGGLSKYVAKLTGVAPNEEAKRTAIRDVAGADCDCPWGIDYKVHTVDDSGVSVVAPEPDLATVSPYVFAALHGDGPVVLNGYVPNENVRRNIVEEARGLFPQGVVDNLQLAAGRPNGDWRGLASTGLTQLSRLDRGEFRLTDTAAVLTGEASTQAIKADIDGVMGALPSPFEGGANVTVPGVDLGQMEIRSRAVCQSLFNQMKGESKINFRSGSAIIDQSSHDLLDRLATAAKQCTGFDIALEGHTDSDGDEAFNQQLSAARAQAALDYLRAQGVSAAQMSATGYGETQPIADNATAAGKARNRRIDFTVNDSSN